MSYSTVRYTKYHRILPGPSCACKRVRFHRHKTSKNRPTICRKQTQTITKQEQKYTVSGEKVTP